MRSLTENEKSIIKSTIVMVLLFFSFCAILLYFSISIENRMFIKKYNTIKDNRNYSNWKNNSVWKAINKINHLIIVYKE